MQLFSFDFGKLWFAQFTLILHRKLTHITVTSCFFSFREKYIWRNLIKPKILKICRRSSYQITSYFWLADSEFPNKWFLKQDRCDTLNMGSFLSLCCFICFIIMYFIFTYKLGVASVVNSCMQNYAFLITNSEIIPEVILFLSLSTTVD